MKRNHHNHHNHPRNREQSHAKRNQSRNQHYANELLKAVLLTAFFVFLFGAIALMVPTQ